jgi:hypothetical protein
MPLCPGKNMGYEETRKHRFEMKKLIGKKGWWVAKSGESAGRAVMTNMRLASRPQRFLLGQSATLWPGFPQP